MTDRTPSQIQADIKQAAHDLRQRFDQVETVGYAEVMQRVGALEALAAKLPDAPTSEAKGLATVVDNQAGAASGGPSTTGVAQPGPLTVEQHIQNLGHLVETELWHLYGEVKKAAKAARAKG
jgi:hypothetical protein